MPLVLQQPQSCGLLAAARGSVGTQNPPGYAENPAKLHHNQAKVAIAPLAHAAAAAKAATDPADGRADASKVQFGYLIPFAGNSSSSLRCYCLECFDLPCICAGL